LGDGFRLIEIVEVESFLWHARGMIFAAEARCGWLRGKARNRRLVFENSLKKPAGCLVLGLVEKLRGLGAFRNAAIGYERDEIRSVAGKSHFMGYEDDGFSRGSEFRDDIQNLGGHLGIESGGGFVEEQKSGINSEGPSDGDALALTAAELRGLFSGMIEQLESREELFCAGIGFLRGKAVNLLEWEADILKRGEVGEEVVGLEDDSEFLAMGAKSGFIGRTEFSIDSDFSGVRQFETREEA
jgi:hypothetical protein